MRTEPDITTNADRFAKQPFFALIELFRALLPAEDNGRNHEIAAEVNTLQIWPHQSASTSTLLAQVCYVLDSGFLRRYVCVIFVIDTYMQEIMEKWLEALGLKMTLWTWFKPWQPPRIQHLQDIITPKHWMSWTLHTHFPALSKPSDFPMTSSPNYFDHPALPLGSHKLQTIEVLHRRLYGREVSGQQRGDRCANGMQLQRRVTWRCAKQPGGKSIAFWSQTWVGLKKPYPSWLMVIFCDFFHSNWIDHFFR